MSLHAVDQLTIALESLHVVASAQVNTRTAVENTLEQSTKENIDRLLCKGSVIGDSISIIRSNLIPCKMEIVGDEVYRLLGYEFCTKKLRNSKYHEAISPDFLSDCSMPFEALTFRFELKGAQNGDLVNLIRSKVCAKVGVQSVSKLHLISDQKTKFYLFTFFNQGQKVHFVFYKELQSQFVATADALQVIVHENGEYSLQDHGYGELWAKDTYTKVYRVINGEGSNIVQLISRALDRGFSLTIREYELFKTKCQADQAANTLYLLWNSAINEQGSLRKILHICNLCHGAGMEEALAAFMKRVVPEHVQRYGRLEEKEDFESLSVAMLASGMLSYLEWCELVQFLGLFNGMHSALDVRLPMHTFMRLVPELHKHPVFERFLKHFDPLPEGKGKKLQVSGILPAASIIRYEQAKEGHDVRSLYLPSLLLAAVSKQDDFVRYALASLPEAAKLCGHAMHHLIGQGMRRLFESFSLILPEHLQNGGLSSEQIEREWIGFLLCQPHAAFFQAGIAYLLTCNRYLDLQLKICPILVQTNPQQAAIQIVKHQDTITNEQLVSWIISSKHKYLIVSELLHRSPARFLAPCVAFFPEEVAGICQTSTSEELLLVLTKVPPSSHSRSIVSWWAKRAHINTADRGLRAHLDEVVKLDGWTEDAKMCLTKIIRDARSQSELIDLLSSYSTQVENFAQFESKLTEEQVIFWLKDYSEKGAVVSDLLRANLARWLIPLAHFFPEEVLRACPSPTDALLQMLLEKERVPFILFSYLAARISQGIQIFQALNISPSTVMLHLCQHRHHAAVWESSFVACFKACALELSDKQYKRHAFEFLPLLLHPQAALHDINFVSQILQVLASRDFTAKSYEMSKGYLSLSTVLSSRGLYLETLSLMRLQQVAIGRPLSKDDSEAVIESMRQSESAPEAMVRWYLALELPYKVSAESQVRNILAICQKHPGLIAEKSKSDLIELHKRIQPNAGYPVLQAEIAASLPKGFSSHFEPYAIKQKVASQREPAPKQDPVARAAEQLLQEDVSRKDVEKVIEELLFLNNPDPQRQVFALLRCYNIYSVPLWKRALSRFFEKQLFSPISHGIDTFRKIKDEKANGFRKSLWTELFDHFAWIEMSESVQVFKELSSLEHELGFKVSGDKLILALSFLISALEKNKDLHVEYLPIALDLTTRLPNSHADKAALCWRLLSLCSGDHTSDVIAKASSLLISVLPRLQSCDSLVSYLRATCLPQNCKVSVDPLKQLIKHVHNLSSFESNAALVRQLAYHPELSVKEALTDSMISLLKEMSKNNFSHPSGDEIAAATTELRNVLVRCGGVNCLQKIYGYIMLREGQLPSTTRLRWNEAIATFDPEVPNTPTQNGLLPFTLSYPRFLAEVASSKDPQEIRDALDIDLSLSIHNKKNAPLVRRYFDNYNKIAILLFLRQLEHFGWDQVSQNFFRLMAQRAITPHVLSNLYNPQRDDLTLVHKEHYKVSKVDTNRAGFYECKKDSMTLRVIPILSTSRQTLLMSETSYQVFVCTLIETSLERVKNLQSLPESRSKVLDLAASNLAVLCELYPQNPEIPKLFRSLCFSISPNDALWNTHASIFSSLYRLAVLHGALEAKSPLFDECVAYLPVPNAEVRKQTAAIVGEVAKEAGEMIVGKKAFSVDRLIEFQESLAKWRETSFSGSSNFGPMLDCLKRLFSLWVMHPEVLDCPKVMQTMNTLLIPRRRFFGVGLDDQGNSFAYQAASELFKRLMFLYQTLQKTLPEESITIRKQNGRELDISLKPEAKRYMECLKWILGCSKIFLRAQAFDTHYSDWTHHCRSLFDLMFDAVNEPFMPLIGERLIDYTITLCQAVPGTLHYKARIELIADWMRRVFAYKGRYDEHVKIHVLVGLVQANIIRDIQEAELPELLRWMHMMNEVRKNIPTLSLVNLAGQLRRNKWTSKDCESGKAFWKAMPKFIQLM